MGRGDTRRHRIVLFPQRLDAIGKVALGKSANEDTIVLSLWHDRLLKSGSETVCKQRDLGYDIIHLQIAKGT